MRKKNTKQRILDTAKTLFAQKGYHAVGIREITRTAQVNIAMVNYYFGGKIGILKEIMDQAYSKHQQAIINADINLPAKKHIRFVIKNYIEFFRSDIELALVAFDTMLFDIPEIIDLKKAWTDSHMQLLRQLFKKLRLSLNDNAHISLFNGLLGNIILAHFRERYSWEISTRKPSREYDDEFYEKYARTLTNFYLAGVKGVATVAEKIKTNK